MERELQVAIDAAKKAGAAVAEIYNRDDFKTVEKADGKGPLTEADLAANQILIDCIQAAFPDDAILSEETVDTPERLTNSRVWIIDPLDGTREFTLHIPEFCVSVGFTLNGEAVAGALFNPATGELIAGAKGLGVTYNGEAASCSDKAGLEGSRFLVSRSEFKKGWFDDYKDTCELTPMGSVAWKFGLVAVGRAEASFTPKPRNEWDLCAGVACIVAGGGRATNGAGVDYTFNRPDPLHIGVCGNNGRCHDDVLALIQR